MGITSSGYLLVAELIGRSTSLLYILLSILIGAALCLLVSDAAGNMSRQYPASQGPRTWFTAAFGNHIGLMLTYCLLFVVLIFAGVECFVLFKCIEFIWPNTVNQYYVIFASLAVVVGINLRSLELPHKVQAVATCLLIFIILLVSLLGYFTAGGVAPAAASSSTTEEGGELLISLIGISIFFFIGFEWVVTQGSSKKDFEVHLPRAMSTSIVVLALMNLLFVTCAWKWMGASSAPDVNSPILHLEIGKRIFGHAGSILMLIFSVIALFTTFNAGLLGASRLVYSLSREGALPKFLSNISLKTGSPTNAVLAIGAGALAFSLLETYFSLQISALILCSAIYCVIYSALLIAEVKRINSKKHGKWYKFSGAKSYLLLITAIFLICVIVASVTEDLNYGLAAALGLLAVIVSAFSLATVNHFKLVTKNI